MAWCCAKSIACPVLRYGVSSSLGMGPTPQEAYCINCEKLDRGRGETRQRAPKVPESSMTL